MLENETIIELATRMLAKRQETGNEIESSIYGITVSTENCQNPEDIELQVLKARIEIYEKNAEEAKHNYLMAAFAEQYQKREKGSSIPILVVTPQAEELQRKEQDKQKEASNQFYLDFQTMNDIDWNNSDEVYGWMATIADDLNNFDARLPLNKIYSEEELSALQQKYQTERLSSAQVVLNELEKHGYTGDKIEIHSKDDFNRQYIANYINELKSYGMLLTEKYVDVLKEEANGIEDEVINVVYRQAQDVLENSQDKNIDRVAFDDKKMEIAEEISDVTRRREKINFILDVAKALPSLELIANATTAVQVSSDVKKEKLEAKLATITEKFDKQIGDNPTRDNSDDEYASYEESYIQQIDNIIDGAVDENENKVTPGLKDEVKKAIEELYQKGLNTEKINRANQTMLLENEYNKLLQKTKLNATNQKLPSQTVKKPSPAFFLEDPYQNKQVFANIILSHLEHIYNSTPNDIEKSKGLINDINNDMSLYMDSEVEFCDAVKKAINDWEDYYNTNGNSGIISPQSQPVINLGDIRELMPIRGIARAEEGYRDLAFRQFNVVNSGHATKEQIEKTKETIEKLPESPYRNALMEGMAKWEQYYTTKDQFARDESQENKIPVVDTDAIIRLISTQPIIGANFDEVAVIEMIEKLPESAYRNALTEGMTKWDEYYLEKYHPEIIAQRKEEEKKPKIDSETIRRLKPYTSTKEENMALEQFNTINSGNATEEQIKATNELIERFKRCHEQME